MDLCAGDPSGLCVPGGITRATMILLGHHGHQCMGTIYYSGSVVCVCKLIQQIRLSYRFHRIGR